MTCNPVFIKVKPQARTVGHPYHAGRIGFDLAGQCKPFVFARQHVFVIGAIVDLLHDMQVGSIGQWIAARSDFAVYPETLSHGALTAARTGSIDWNRLCNWMCLLHNRQIHARNPLLQRRYLPASLAASQAPTISSWRSPP